MLHDSPSIQLVAVSSATSVSQHMLIGGARSASISAARNETESFQVVVSTPKGVLREVDATVSELKNAAGDVISGDCIDVFCNNFVPVRIPDPQSDMPPGMWADALVPRIDPYTGEPTSGPQWEEHGYRGERFRGQGYDVWERQQQPIWIDVGIPRDAKPGIYKGAVNVTAKNAATASIPVNVEVWDFELPDGPTLENHFGGFERAAWYWGVTTDSEKYYELEDRYIEMLVAHRINPPFPGDCILSYATMVQWFSVMSSIVG